MFTRAEISTIGKTWEYIRINKKLSYQYYFYSSHHANYGEMEVKISLHKEDGDADDDGKEQ